MRPAPSFRKPPLWLFVSLGWLAPAVLAVFQSYARARIGGETASARHLVFEGADWLLYALLTPAVFWMAARVRLRRGALGWQVPMHVAASIVLCAAWAAGGVMLSRVLTGQLPYGSSPLAWFFTSLPFGVAVYFAVLGAEHAAHYFVQARDREAQAARLAAQLSEARLGALRMQMQPHFLLNSLNTITVIVRDRDIPAATRMLEHLGDMLRRTLRADRPQEVTLAEELDFVRQYLAIEQVRYSDRLVLEIRVPPALMGVAVPEFLLQPLVENAIRHGLSQRTGPTRLQLEAAAEDEHLVLVVRDDGTERPTAPGPVVERVGLGNTRERLRTLYGAGAHLTLDRTARGATVTVRLPLRRLEPAGA